MNDTDQQLVTQPPLSDPQSPTAPVAPIDHGAATQSQTDKPKPVMSDKEAQALLAINNLQTSRPVGPKLPIGLLISVVALVLLVVLASFLLGSLKNPTANSATSGSSRASSSNQSGSNSSKNISNQINQDVNACSNPVNALSEC